MLVEILSIICLIATALILMVGASLQKDTEIESAVRIMKIAFIPAALSVLLSWLGALI